MVRATPGPNGGFLRRLTHRAAPQEAALLFAALVVTGPATHTL